MSQFWCPLRDYMTNSICPVIRRTVGALSSLDLHARRLSSVKRNHFIENSYRASELTHVCIYTVDAVEVGDTS